MGQSKTNKPGYKKGKPYFIIGKTLFIDFLLYASCYLLSAVRPGAGVGGHRSPLSVGGGGALCTHSAGGRVKSLQSSGRTRTTTSEASALPPECQIPNAIQWVRPRDGTKVFIKKTI